MRVLVVDDTKGYRLTCHDVVGGVQCSLSGREKCLELPCDDDVAIHLVLGFARQNPSSNSHERDAWMNAR